MKTICSRKRAAVISAEGTVAMASFEKMSISGDSNTERTISVRP